MTDYAEEQTNELEVLRSIFPDELEVLDEGPPASFHIRVELDPSVLHEGAASEGDASPPTLYLAITYTPTYPDEIPQLSLTDVTGIDETEQQALLSELETVASESLGMAMVFSIASAAREGFERIITERIERLAREEEERIAREEEEERQRYAGNKVTAEAFETWKLNFIAEISKIIKAGGKLTPAQSAAAAVAGLLPSTSKNGKLTGRQLFEKDKSLAKSDMAYMEDGDVAVDVELFEGMDDLDLEDEDDDNDVLRNFTEDD
ncbi:RWD domain-containing protein 1 [Borealophlyctis nickersoniae]|nr:RWD domain-containing protein 1 [Borealophlyctis nickersoniae]